MEKIQKFVDDFQSIQSEHNQEKITDKSIKPLITSIRNHRDFIYTSKKNNFSKIFVLGFLFRLWKVQSKYYKNNKAKT